MRCLQVPAMQPPLISQLHLVPSHASMEHSLGGHPSGCCSSAERCGGWGHPPGASLAAARSCCCFGCRWCPERACYHCDPTLEASLHPVHCQQLPDRSSDFLHTLATISALKATHISSHLSTETRRTPGRPEMDAVQR